MTTRMSGTPLSRRHFMVRITSPIVTEISGTRMRSAPPARPPNAATQPVARPQRAWRVLAEKTSPTIGDPEDLVPERVRAEDDGADRRVQPRGVPAAREHADAQG